MAVGLGLAVGVGVEVGVAEGIGVGVSVGVIVGVAEAVGVGVGVAVGVDVAVEVVVGRCNINSNPYADTNTYCKAYSNSAERHARLRLGVRRASQRVQKW